MRRLSSRTDPAVFVHRPLTEPPTGSGRSTGGQLRFESPKHRAAVATQYGQRNEYLAAENRILRAQLNGCLRLSDAERATLGEIGFRLGRKTLSEVATVAQPDTILAWHRRLIARKFEGSRARRVRGRPRIDREVERLIIRMAEENRSWGYDRIVGALPNWDTPGQTPDHLGRIHSDSPRVARRNGHFRGRGPYARIGDLLRAVFYIFEEPSD
jgi:hypothetical protein